MSALIEVKELRVVYDGKTILDIPQLSVEAGETLGIIGPNGSGKSTLLRVLALLEKPHKGALFFAGERVNYRGNLLPYRRRLALVMQQPLMRHTTTFENVATGLRFRGVGAEEIQRRVREWLNRLGIAHLERRNAPTLSLGEAQRTSLSRALVLEPELLLLDEPFASLDAPTRSSLLEDLRGILSLVRVATVFVTHDRDEALAFSDRLAVLMEGRIQQVGSPQEVFGSPVSEAVAAFVGAENILSGRVARHQDGLSIIRVQGREIELVGEYPLGEEIAVCFRPEDVVLAPDSGKGLLPSSARNKLPGKVSRFMPRGAQFRVVVDCGFPLASLVTKQSFSDLSLGEGKEVIASFKASSLHIVRRRARKD